MQFAEAVRRLLVEWELDMVRGDWFLAACPDTDRSSTVLAQLQTSLLPLTATTLPRLGWDGRLLLLCAAFACLNGGTCLDRYERGAYCLCAEGFVGSRCATDVRGKHALGSINIRIVTGPGKWHLPALLRSLLSAEYDNDRVDVTVFTRPEQAWGDSFSMRLQLLQLVHAEALLAAWQWPHGAATCNATSSNIALLQWVQAAEPDVRFGVDVPVLVITDDTLVSKLFYLWLKRAVAALHDYPHLAGAHVRCKARRSQCMQGSRWAATQPSTTPTTIGTSRNEASTLHTAIPDHLRIWRSHSTGVRSALGRCALRLESVMFRGRANIFPTRAHCEPICRCSLH